MHCLVNCIGDFHLYLVPIDTIDTCKWKAWFPVHPEQLSSNSSFSLEFEFRPVLRYWRFEIRISLKTISSGSSVRVGGGGGPRNMKSMWPNLVAIFFMTYFYRAGGGHAWPPRIHYWQFTVSPASLGLPVNSRVYELSHWHLSSPAMLNVWETVQWLLLLADLISS